MRLSRTSAAIALMCSAACGSFGASDPPAGPSDAGVADGAAGGDGAVTDGGGGGPFCPQAGAVVCEDFESPGGFHYAGWTKDDETGRNTMVVEDVAGTPSPSHALHVVAEPGAASATDAYLKAHTAGSVSKLAFEARVRLVASGPNRAILLEVQDGTNTLAVRLRPTGEVEQRQRTADGGSAVSTLGFVQPPVVGDWSRAVLAVDVPNHTVTATVDGDTKTFPLDPGWVPGPLDPRFGLVDASPEIKWEAYYDDVLVTAE